MSRCSIAVTSPTPWAGWTALSPTWKSGDGAWGIGGMEPGGPGRPGGRVEVGRGGGAGGSMRGDGFATRLPFDFACEFDDMGVEGAGAMWAAEPEGAVRAMEVLEDGGAGCATIRGRPASMRGVKRSVARPGARGPAYVDLGARVLYWWRRPDGKRTHCPRYCGLAPRRLFVQPAGGDDFAAAPRARQRACRGRRPRARRASPFIAAPRRASQGSARPDDARGENRLPRRRPLVLHSRHRPPRHSRDQDVRRAGRVPQLGPEHGVPRAPGHRHDVRPRARRARGKVDWARLSRTRRSRPGRAGQIGR